MTRNNTVDSFRALAVMLVTAFHVARWMEYPSIPLPWGFDVLAPLSNGWIGVGIFFVISGYCMGASTQRSFSNGLRPATYGGYLIKRFLRIALPYYASIAVWYVLINRYGIAVKPTASVDIISHLLFVHNLSSATLFTISGVFWSIAVEVQFYLLLPFMIAFLPGKWPRLGLLVVSASLLAWVNLTPGVSIIHKFGLANYLFLFVVGWLLYSYQGAICRFISKKRIAPMLMLIALALLFYGGGNATSANRFYEASVAVLAGISMIVLAHAARPGNVFGEITALIGRCSFSIYLYNYIFFAIKPTGYNAAVFIVAFVAVIGFGVLMYYVVEYNTEKFRKCVLQRHLPLSQ